MNHQVASMMDTSLCSTFNSPTDIFLADTSLHTPNEDDIAFASESSFDALISLLRRLGDDTSHPISSSLLFTLSETVGSTMRLPHVLKTLRMWRTLEREDRFSQDTLMRLALDLSRVLDRVEKGDDESALVARIKWISQDYWQETQSGIEAPGVTDELDRPPSVSSRPSSVSGRCARHQHETAAYRSGCSACRLPRHPAPPVPFLPPSLSVRSHNVLSSRRSFVLKHVRDENTNPSTSVPLLKANSTRPRSRSLPRKPSSLPVKSPAKPRRTIFGQSNV
ncbi:hypothetical protein BDZ89DRAFT_1137772 [Hymenopellis radicata]|nr:hypothetical protein BDZ89DRAFT_1137772 [Hymenopellis radicata]